MVKVYVAGPLNSSGNVAANIRKAYEAADTLASCGFAPYVPHHTHFWDILFPRTSEFWMELDFEFLACCDALLRLPGPSTGADMEESFAMDHDIPTFFDIQTLAASMRGE